MSLKAEVRTLRETQARLEKRLERLELLTSVSQARAAPAAATPPAASPLTPPPTSVPLSPAAAASSAVVTPELAVVKLKPRAEPAPALPVNVDVVEPPDEEAEVFTNIEPAATAKASREGVEALEAAPDGTGQDAVFDQAMAALRTGNVEGGVASLLEFSEKNPRHSRADNALYFSGIGQMGLKDYAAAAGTFERLITRYPAGDAVLDGMLRLAECRLRLERKDDARALYTRILTQFPGTAAATQAEQRLASLSH